jgi:hypothetical protein
MRADYDRAPAIDTIVGRPPAPDFFDPVDYVAWMKEQFAVGEPPGVAEAYSRFWPAPRSPEPGLARPPEPVRDRLLALATGPGWQPDDYPAVDDYLSSAAPMLEVFKAEVEAAPGYQFAPEPDEQDPMNPFLLLLPNISGSRRAVPCLLALAWREGADRKARLLEAWRLGLVHAKHLQESRQLIIMRAAFAVRLAVYDSMRAAASLKAIDGDGIEAALRLLVDVDPGPPDLRESVRIEWGGTLGFLQSMYPRGRLNRKLAEMIGYVSHEQPTGPRFVKSDEVRTSGVSPAKLAKAVDHHYFTLLSIVKDPLTLRTIEQLGQHDAANAVGPLRGHPLRSSVQPSYYLVVREALRAETTRRATRLVLAVLTHLRNKGRLPTALAEVCHDQRECIDPCSGEEFVYTVSDPSAPDGFRLYSVGEDGADDGGDHGPWSDINKRALPTGRDFVFWPFQRESS